VLVHLRRAASPHEARREASPHRGTGRPPASIPAPAGGDVLAMQRLAGNAAVAATIQRDGDPPDVHKGRRSHGADVRAALQAQLPGLLAALSPEQVAAWQEYLDWKADQGLEAHQMRDLNSEFGEYERADIRDVDPEYAAKKRRIERDAQKAPRVTGTTVDPHLLLADDIMAPTDWDRDAEMGFRQWAVAEVTRAPIQVIFADPDQDQFNLHAMSGLASFSHGIVTTQELETYYRDQYEAQVSKRPLWRELGQVLSDMEDAVADSKVIHSDWLEKNKHVNWFIRWTSETLGSGSTDLPAADAWVEPDAMRARCQELLAQHKLEVLAPFIEATGQKVYKVITDVEAYDHRVTSGAQTAIKWAQRLKTAGSIAAGIASGGLGLTGSALVAGGYSFAQGAAEQMSGVSHGLQDKVDWSGLATQAGVTTLLAVAGGALQSRFQAAWEPRLASFGPELGKRMAGVAAAGTSSFYTTGAELAINHFVSGAPLPASVDDLADMIITNALEGAGMDIATHAAGEKARAEYEAWKTRRAGEAAGAAEGSTRRPTNEAMEPGGRKGPTEPGPGAKGPAEPAPKTGPVEISPRDMPEEAVKSLLRTGGGWERLSAELEGGTGLGAGMMPAERRALLARFETYRRSTAIEVGALFDGHVVGGEGTGTLQLAFDGPMAADHAAQAKAYLDAKRPAWNQETGLTLETPAQPAVDPAIGKALKGIEYGDHPTVKRLGAAFGSQYSSWPKTVPERLNLIRAIANAEVRAVGAPDMIIELGTRGPMFDAVNWRIELPPGFLSTHAPSVEEFAFISDRIAHETRHAIQDFTAARTATGPDVAKVGMRPDVLQAAQTLGVAGNKSVAALDPRSLEFAEAREYFESLWGTGLGDRVTLLSTTTGTLFTTRDALDLAVAAEKQAFARMSGVMNLPEASPLRQVAIEDFIAAAGERAAAGAKHDIEYQKYRNLVDEVDAWAHGEAVGRAVKNYVRLKTALDQAQLAEQRASAALAAASYELQTQGGRADLAESYRAALARWQVAVASSDHRAKDLSAAISGARP
jgi:hypothetical protein